MVLSKKTAQLPGSDAPKPSRTHTFDAGTAWGYLALEAMKLGWAAHGMAGFDVERTMVDLKIPDDYRVEAAVAVGRKGDPSLLPDYLRAREMPNGRNPQKDFVFAGDFPAG
jgi:hypothetical protein